MGIRKREAALKKRAAMGIKQIPELYL